MRVRKQLHPLTSQLRSDLYEFVVPNPVFRLELYLKDRLTYFSSDNPAFTSLVVTVAEYIRLDLHPQTHITYNLKGNTL